MPCRSASLVAADHPFQQGRRGLHGVAGAAVASTPAARAGPPGRTGAAAAAGGQGEERRGRRHGSARADSPRAHDVVPGTRHTGSDIAVAIARAAKVVIVAVAAAVLRDPGDPARSGATGTRSGASGSGRPVVLVMLVMFGGRTAGRLARRGRWRRRGGCCRCVAGRWLRRLGPAAAGRQQGHYSGGKKKQQSLGGHPTTPGLIRAAISWHAARRAAVQRGAGTDRRDPATTRTVGRSPRAAGPAHAGWSAGPRGAGPAGAGWSAGHQRPLPPAGAGSSIGPLRRRPCGLRIEVTAG